MPKTRKRAPSATEKRRLAERRAELRAAKKRAEAALQRKRSRAAKGWETRRENKKATHKKSGGKRPEATASKKSGGKPPEATAPKTKEALQRSRAAKKGHETRELNRLNFLKVAEPFLGTITRAYLAYQQMTRTQRKWILDDPTPENWRRLAGKKLPHPNDVSPFWYHHTSA